MCIRDRHTAEHFIIGTVPYSVELAGAIDVEKTVERLRGELAHQEKFLSLIHICDEYKFLFIAKGGGSANKTYLYQETKALLTEERLFPFLDVYKRQIPM